MLNYFFNLGRLLGLIIIIQVISGLLLVLYYTVEDHLAFNSIQYLIIEVNIGWLIRLLHFNMVSFFFLILFLHLLKALFFFSNRLKLVWFTGLLIFLLIIMEAFLGYALIWSQISFWAATVITSLIRVIPFFGGKIIVLLWGGYYLNSFSLKFFFLIHFSLPVLIFIIIFFHLVFLHKYGSSNGMINSAKFNKRSFFPFFWVKDFVNFIFLVLFILVFLMEPFKFNEFLRFVRVNNLVSPIHIVPEWYFLWAYAILRAFSIKWVGVLIILFRVLVFFFLKGKLIVNDLLIRFIVFIFFFNFLFLIWLGGQEPLPPFVDLSFWFSGYYFFLLLIMNFKSTIIIKYFYFSDKK